jgi:hypothetical protein
VRASKRRFEDGRGAQLPVTTSLGILRTVKGMAFLLTDNPKYMEGFGE